MKIEVVEVSDLHQLLCIPKRYDIPADVHQAVGTQHLQHPIYMHWRKPKGIGKVVLGHRKLVVAVAYSSDSSEPLAHLQDEVGEALRSLTPADVDNPLAKDCSIDERFAPQRLGDQRAGAGQGTQTVMRDECDGAGRKRFKVVVHDMKMKALKVRNISSDVDRKDLAPALVGGLGPDAVAVDHEAGLRGFVSLADDRCIRRELLYVDRKSPDGLDIVCIQVGVIPQLADHRFEVRHLARGLGLQKGSSARIHEDRRFGWGYGNVAAAGGGSTVSLPATRASIGHCG